MIKAIKHSMAKGSLVLLLLIKGAMAIDDGLARTPPMGWNHWYEFFCEGITEDLFVSMTDALVANGMKDAGYEYINIDDCWEGSRDAAGFISTTDDFTNNSMETLSKYIHDKGLKFGIYTSIGIMTCQQFPGSWDYRQQDAQRYAGWEVDFVKVDWCFYGQTEPPLSDVNWRGGTDFAGAEWGYKQMYDAWQGSGRPMVHSICKYGIHLDYIWGSRVGHMWRIGHDLGGGWGSIMRIIDQNAPLYPYSGPAKGWNDADILLVGVHDWTPGQQRVNFGMWCIMNSPLLAGNDLRSMNSTTLNILTNKEVIAVNQDSLGIQAQRVQDNGDLEVWAKPMRGNARAVALLNRSGSTGEITVQWTDLDKWSDFNWEGHGFPGEDLSWPADKEVMVRNLWGKQDIRLHSGSFSMEVPARDVAMLKLSALPGPGCTDPAAENYAANATPDDGSCTYMGCTDKQAANYFCTEHPIAFPCTQANGYTVVNITDDNSCATGIEFKGAPWPPATISGPMISVEYPASHAVRVLNVHGETLFLQSGTRAATYRLPTLEAGIYFIKVKSGSFTFSKRILIK